MKIEKIKIINDVIKVRNYILELLDNAELMEASFIEGNYVHPSLGEEALGKDGTIKMRCLMKETGIEFIRKELVKVNKVLIEMGIEL